MNNKTGNQFLIIVMWLTKIFDESSGLVKPENDDEDSPYEQQLKSCFVEGMHPDTSRRTKKTFIRWDTA